MDGKGNQRRGFRPPPRNPRRVPTVRVLPNMANHRVENHDGNNHMNNNGGRMPLPPLQFALFNQNQPNPFANMQPGYVSFQPIHPQATHIAIPLNQARCGPPQGFANGPPGPVPNGTVHIGNMNPNMPGMVRVSAPPAMNIPPPRIINGPPFQMRHGAPGFSREQPVAGPSAPLPPPSAFIVCPDGGLITIPSTIYTAPTISYVGMPVEAQVSTVTYTYTEGHEQVYAPAAHVPNGVGIIDEEEFFSFGELQITEMYSSHTDDSD